jgi:hypothetical protein
MDSGLTSRVTAVRAHRVHKTRADNSGQPGPAVAAHRLRAGDSRARVSTTVVHSVPGQVAEPDAPTSEDLVRLGAALADHDPAHAPEDSAALVPPAGAASAVLVPPGRESSGIRTQADPGASAAHGPAHAQVASVDLDPSEVVASAAHDPPGREGSEVQAQADPGASAAHDPEALADLDRAHDPEALADLDPQAVASIAISDRVGRVRLGRAMAIGRRDRPSRGAMKASPIKKPKIPSARHGVNGDPPRDGLPDPLGRTVPTTKLLIVRVSKLRGRARTNDGIPSNVLVRAGRVPARVRISGADRARSGQALGSAAVDRRARHRCRAETSRSASTEAPAHPRQ